MESFSRKEHWENIYNTKKLNEVSWFQPTPEISLEFIKECKLKFSDAIIDVGGGDSFLADNLIDLGFKDITVLDISESAIRRAEKRLGIRAEKVNWIVADAALFMPEMKYDFWHDRAAFHFLTEENDIANYLDAIQKGIKTSGFLLIGTFSEQGPKKCSGLEIRQYSEASLSALLQPYFEKIKCLSVDHKTPFDTIQNFIFCLFRRK